MSIGLLQGARGTPGARGAAGGRGFTLLELVISITLLAVFLLPLMAIVSRSKVRAVKFTQLRELRDLSQRKLFDVVHSYEVQQEGTFEAEGHSDWEWRVLPPEMVGQGEQVLLEYVIQVDIPQRIESLSSSETETGSTYELRLWSFPDQRWYDDQEYLYQLGQPSILYGDPAYGGGFGGAGGGFPGTGF